MREDDSVLFFFQLIDLVDIGRERFPQDEQLARTWRMLNPRPARVTKSTWHSTPEYLQATNDWLDEHAHEYPLGHWLVVRNDNCMIRYGMCMCVCVCVLFCDE